MLFRCMTPQYFNKYLIKIFSGIIATLPLDDWKMAIFKLLKLISSFLLTWYDRAEPYQALPG